MEEARARIVEYGQVFFVFALALTITWGYAWSSILTGAIAVLWLLKPGSLKEKWRSLMNSPMIWLPLALVLVYAISIYYSDNSRLALIVVNKKLPLALLSIGLATSAVTEWVVSQVKVLFTVGVTTVILTLDVIALWKILSGSLPSFPSYHEFSGLLNYHAIYLSLYVLIALIFLVNKLRSGLPFFSRQLMSFNILWILFLIVNLLILASKTLVAVAFLLLIPVAYYQLREKVSKGLLWGGLTVFLATGAILVWNFTSVGDRYREEWNSNWDVIFSKRFAYNTEFTGTSLRLVIWKHAWDALNQNDAILYGVGAGDAKHTLDDMYKKSGMYVGNPTFGDRGYLGYNAHNQFVETMLSTGMIGALLLLSFAILYMRNASHNRCREFLFIFLIFWCFSFTESTLETQRGVMCISFFSALFAAHKNSHDRATAKT